MSKNFKQLSVKYRPVADDLSDMVGNEEAVADAKRIVRNEDAHAILLYGPTGSGKTTLAKWIANQLTKFPTDIEEENMSAQRGIDKVRELINKSKFLPKGKFRVFILDECHQLLGQSQSAVLKTLEEPEHDRVVWILCTNKPHMLDSELLNRCLKIGVKKPSEDQVAKLVFRVAKKEDAFKLKKEKLKKLCHEIAKASECVPREALQLLQSVASKQGEYSNFKELVIQGVRRNAESGADKIALKVIMALYSTKKDANFRANWLVNSLYDVDIWGVTTRLVTIHHALVNHAAGIKAGPVFYYVKELSEQEAVPDLKRACKVAVKLVALANQLQTTNTSLQNFVVPELVNILYSLSKD